MHVTRFLTVQKIAKLIIKHYNRW